jgi:hypothetical protein
LVEREAFQRDGEGPCTVADAAVLLGVSQRDVEALIASARDPYSIPAGATMIATIETPDGTFIADREISRLRSAYPRSRERWSMPRGP